MIYPTHVYVSLLEANGSSCGPLNNRFTYVPDSNPPEYFADAYGDFYYGHLQRVTLSGEVVTWDLTIVQPVGTCSGYYPMRRSTAADNPVGNYCLRSGSTLNCEAAKASVVDDD